MADKIATEGYAHDIGSNKNVSYTSNRGCTKDRAIALGCKLSSPSSGYSSNRLVRESDLRRPGGTFTLKNNTSYPINGSWDYEVSAGEVFLTGDPGPGQTYTCTVTHKEEFPILIYKWTGAVAGYSGSTLYLLNKGNGSGQRWKIRMTKVSGSSSGSVFEFTSSGSNQARVYENDALEFTTS